MSILRNAWKLESKIAGRLERAAKGVISSGALEPLEIVHAVVETVQHGIQAGSRGRAVFPFNRIALTFPAPSSDARLKLESILNGDPSVRRRIEERLRMKGCPSDDLRVDIEFVGHAEPAWPNPDFHVVLERVEPPPPAVVSTPAPELPTTIALTVLSGVAAQETLSFATARVNLGRGPEVRTARNRLIRTNHVVFTEEAGEVNRTVSRQHAHIAYDAASKGYRLFDDASGHGTGLVREGRTIVGPARRAGTSSPVRGRDHPGRGAGRVLAALRGRYGLIPPREVVTEARPRLAT